MFWIGQATWVSIVALPIFALNAIPAGLHPALNWKDFLGIGLWATGFLTEVIADRQKSQWRKKKDEKKHNEEWISSGLWGKSRHPNYFGSYLPNYANSRGEYNLGGCIPCFGTCTQLCPFRVSFRVRICYDHLPSLHKSHPHKGNPPIYNLTA
jgi:hypothetical protein